MDHIDECPICYEPYVARDKDVEMGIVGQNEPLEVQGCGHAFCRNCLVDHCKHAITAREIPIRCPAHGYHQCSHILQEHQVKDLLQLPTVGNNDDLEETSLGVVKYGSFSDAVPPKEKDSESGVLQPHHYWTHFQRFLQKLQDPTLINCTRCDELVSPHHHQLQQQQHQAGKLVRPTHPNDVLCPHCGHQFCAVHGDAHLQQSCLDFQPTRQDRHHDMKSIQAIRRFAKPCSHCGIPIYKESGCDHIICASCKQDMCFRCGSHEYLTGEMVRSCSKCDQNYIDHRYIWRYRMTLCLSLPLYIPLCFLHVLVMATLAIATCGCCCCLGCGLKQVESDDSKDDDNRDNANRTPQSTKDQGKLVFRPWMGFTTVLAIIFLPVVDLANQCGVPCCLDIPGITTAGTSFDSENDDDDSSEVDFQMEGEP